MGLNLGLAVSTSLWALTLSDDSANGVTLEVERDLQVFALENESVA